MLERERTRFWQWAFAAGLLSLPIAPVLPLVVNVFRGESTIAVWSGAFRDAIVSSLFLGVGVAAVSLLLGLPLGLLAALYRFPGRSPLVLVQALPLLLPSFLPCIGWSNLAAADRLSWLPAPSGFAGCLFVFGLQAVPLSFFATWAACRNLTASQIDAARTHGGERTVLTQTARACVPVVVLAASLAGILTLSDPGAPLILGCRSVAVEIRTSFSALYNFNLAGRQCLVLAGLVLVLTLPMLIVGLPSLATAMLARQTRPAVPYPHRVLSWVAMLGLVSFMTLGMVIPALGLCLPALENPMLGRATEKVGSTIGSTFFYTGGAALVAISLALCVALVTAGDARLRLFVLTVLLMLLAFPPALAALGVTSVATDAPPFFDWITRSRLTVALILGLRFFPVATVAMMRAVGSLAPSWTDAALVHGVSRARRFSRVVVPALMPGITVGLLLVMVLSAADITTTHLLQPPGKPSLPVAIFTVMANSPQGLVASLCLVYLLSVTLFLFAASWLPRFWSRRLP